jgi:hypothetical protein
MVSSHPSKVLPEAFKHMPYQGTAPESADFIFIGLDANYSLDIEASKVFPLILEYHADGTGFRGLDESSPLHAVKHQLLLADAH